MSQWTTALAIMGAGLTVSAGDTPCDSCQLPPSEVMGEERRNLSRRAEHLAGGRRVNISRA